MVNNLSRSTGGQAASLPGNFETLSLPARLRALRAGVAGRLVFTTSFGLEDQAITHAIAETGVDVALATLDTGRLFPESHDVWAETEERYGLTIRAFAPDPEAIADLVQRDGVNGFRRSVEAREACCAVRKLVPLRRALAGADGWVTGLRQQQSSFRARTAFVGWDDAPGVVKLNPIADWSRADVADYITMNDIPYNVLHDRGFASIGCAPCTRAIRVGEPERAGRWWWENEGKQECGLHLTPAADAAPLLAQG